MADRPAFQFYPGDWKRNANLRRCSPAARGAWIDVLCLMHDSDEYGVLRWPLKEIANAAGISMKLLRELVDKSVLKGDDKNCPAYFFSPTHAGKKGEPIQLIAETSDEPCWFSSRFVRDEYIRQKRGGATRFAGDESAPKSEPKEPGNNEPKHSPKPPFGDGPSVAVAFAVASSEQLPAATVIMRTWWPRSETIKDLEMVHGYAEQWIDQQVPSFVAY